VNGDWFGTTLYGGANLDPNGHSAGTVFKITPSGTLTTLYSFCSHFAQNISQIQCADGQNPSGALALGTDGNLYGQTPLGGTGVGNAPSFEDGTAFKITPGGTFTTLYNFCSLSGCSDGSSPRVQMIQNTDGIFDGVTPAGGNKKLGSGTFFTLSLGLSPFVETHPSSGTVGEAVRILGSDLTGATSVSFNGVAASFTVDSEFLIKATVPGGASSGTLRVVTPGGTLESNLPFDVRQ
jgi:uncharacterized repeat protein (TIGR03803 family)